MVVHGMNGMQVSKSRYFWRIHIIQNNVCKILKPTKLTDEYTSSSGIWSTILRCIFCCCLTVIRTRNQYSYFFSAFCSVNTSSSVADSDPANSVRGYLDPDSGSMQRLTSNLHLDPDLILVPDPDTSDLEHKCMVQLFALFCAIMQFWLQIDITSA